MALAALLVMLRPAPAPAADFDPIFAGSNDFGGVGLLQTPTARMRQDGDLGLGASTVRPYNQIHIFVQLLPWLDSVVRYTDITNVFYGPKDFSGNQHDKEKSVDFKLRLLQEQRYLPQIALGFQDLGGKGTFDSEYLVSSYHYYDFDASLGVAWGRLGAGGGIPNPFDLFGSHFNRNRYSAVTSATGHGGNTGVNYIFTGKTIGPFGGLAWNTPLKGLQLRLEYDGNNYEHEGDNEKIHQASPLNFGLAYRNSSGIDVGVGLERGNTVMARFALGFNLQRFGGVAKTADPAPVAVRPEPVTVISSTPPPPGGAAPPSLLPPLPPGEAADSVDTLGGRTLIENLKAALKDQGATLVALNYDALNKDLQIWYEQDRYRNPAQAVGRVARVLSALAPAEVARFMLIDTQQGVETYRATVLRAEFERAARGESDPQEDLPTVPLPLIGLPGTGDGYASAQYIDTSTLPKFSADMGPAVRQSFGGPNGFYFGQLYWKVAAGVQLTRHFDLTAAGGFNIINDFNQITLKSNSTLPHVRSDIVQYLQQGQNGLLNLETDYTLSPAPNWYGRASAGIFEEMYGGVSTQWLYRPYGRSWALEFDLNRVRQRSFDETFAFRHYMVTTGYAAVFYHPDFFNVLVKLSAGQYLAGDRGATIDISRQFRSGIRLGLFATKTNVSAAQFGEGSFDKGLYITIPLDLFFAQSSRRVAAFAFRPLTRDGGQMVYDGPDLYYTVDGGKPEDFLQGQNALLR